MAYSNGFEEWLRMTSSPNSTSCIIAMDDQTCVYLMQHHLNHLCTPLFDRNRTAGLIRVGIIKVLAPIFFLEKFNMSLIISEMDVFWATDPSIELNTIANLQYDVQLSPHINVKWDKYGGHIERGCHIISSSIKDINS